MTIEDIKQVAREAGDILLSAIRPKIMEKSGHANFVTETDEKVQRFLVDRLKELLPEAEFLGEVRNKIRRFLPGRLSQRRGHAD